MIEEVWAVSGPKTPPEPTVTVSGYTVSVLPEDNMNHYVWALHVEYVGNGNWCVRHVGSCLTKKGDWIWEPSNSGKTKTFLKRTRWDNAEDAIAAAKKAAPRVMVNGRTPTDVLREFG